MMRSFLQLTHNEQTGIKKIPLTINNMVKLIPVSDIIRIESSSNYSIIYFTTGSKLTVSRTLKAFEEHLAPYNFIRIHQSHLINREHVTGFKNGEKAYIIMKGNDVIEISRRKKQEVLQLLKGL